jgi:DNA invertase Pin-like site-specific DNA recombinase
LALQRDPLVDYVKARRWDYEIYQDSASGAKDDRSGLQQLMSDARKRKIDVVLVWKFDCFARSTKMLIEALEEFQALGVDFVSYQENIDTSSPMGKMVFTMISAMAEFERDITKERVKAGMDKAKRQGKKLGRPRVTVTPTEVKELREKGLSVRKIAAAKKISVGMVNKLEKLANEGRAIW